MVVYGYHKRLEHGNYGEMNTFRIKEKRQLEGGLSTGWNNKIRKKQIQDTKESPHAIIYQSYLIVTFENIDRGETNET